MTPIVRNIQDKVLEVVYTCSVHRKCPWTFGSGLFHQTWRFARKADQNQYLPTPYYRTVWSQFNPINHTFIEQLFPMSQVKWVYCPSAWSVLGNIPYNTHLHSETFCTLFTVTNNACTRTYFKAWLVVPFQDWRVQCCLLCSFTIRQDLTNPLLKSNFIFLTAFYLFYWMFKRCHKNVHFPLWGSI